MSGGYVNPFPYPMVPPPPTAPGAPEPPKPRKPWPLRAVNRWMGIGIIIFTLLAVLLAFLAPGAVSAPPATTGMTLAYQSSLTNNDGNWAESETCQFTSIGYEVTAPDPNSPANCMHAGQSYQDFTLHIRVVDANQDAVIGFLSGDRLAIFGAGRFQFYRHDPATGSIDYLLPRTATSLGSVALHPTSLGVSGRTNEIVIQVHQQTYAFYANGQLLATYLSPMLEEPGPILLGTDGGQEALFSDIAIYTPG